MPNSNVGYANEAVVQDVVSWLAEVDHLGVDFSLEEIEYYLDKAPDEAQLTTTYAFLMGIYDTQRLAKKMDVETGVIKCKIVYNEDGTITLAPKI